MICCKPCRAHRVQVAVSVALLVLSVAVTGCRKEKTVVAEPETPVTAPVATPPPTPIPAPMGVFVHKDSGKSPNGADVEFFSLLRFSKDGQVCSVNISTEMDDAVLARYSKACDTQEKDFEYGKYTFINGIITFSLGESEYSGKFYKDRLILDTVYRPTQKSSTDEYRHYDVAYDNQEPGPPAQ